MIGPGADLFKPGFAHSEAANVSCLSSLLIRTGLPARTAVEHMQEWVVNARGKLTEDELLGDQTEQRARPELTQAASRHSYRWCKPPTRGSATTLAVGDDGCVTALKFGVSLFSPKWQRSS